MGRESISGRNFTCLLILMVLCGSLISGAFTVRQDTWISVLMMTIVYLPVILIYCRISALHTGKGLFDIIDELFGRKFGGILIIFMSFFTIVTGGLILHNYTEFTVVISLQETPKIPIMIVLLLSAAFLARKGPTLLGRWSIIIFVLILIHLIVTFLLSLNIAEIGHLLPVMDHSLADIAADSWAMGGIAIGDTVVALALMSYVKKGSSSYKVFLPGILIGIILFTLIMLRNLVVLGPELEEAAQFSTYMAIRVIRIGNFLERVESSISFVYILLGITKMVLYITVAAMGAAHLLKSPNYKKLVFPSSLFILAIGSIVFKSTLEMYDFVWAYRFLALPFQLIIPLIIWIMAEIKKNMRPKLDV